MHNDDEAYLESLGYRQQLFREMGGFSNFAISFSIISILTGAVLLFGYGLKFAGPIVNSVGWPVVSLFTLAVGRYGDRHVSHRRRPHLVACLGGRGWRG
jgi:hypothetical protein